MRSMNFLERTLTLLIVTSGLGHAGIISFQNDLPNSSNGGTTYVNNAAGANQANVAWQSASNFGTGNWYLIGEDFSLSSGTDITQVTVYEVSNGTTGATGAASSADAPQNEFQSIALYYRG